jgi:hypothetical protein
MSDTNYRSIEKILSKKLDFFIDDFAPLKAITKIDRGLRIPLATGELIEIDRTAGIDWNLTFEGQPASSRMWLLSLFALGQLLASHLKTGDQELLDAAVTSLRSYFNYADHADNREALGKIPSADHAAATRVKVLLKFLQVHGSQNLELSDKIVEEISYWTRWIADPSHYSMCNHGLMGDIALLHAGVQFEFMDGETTLNFALDRIVKLALATFDSDGLCNENTIGYHRYNLHLYKNIIRFVEHYGIQQADALSSLRSITERAEVALRQVIWQDGIVPPIGDSAKYEVNLSPINTSKCYFESGFCVVKTDDLYLSFICGSKTETHKQVDDTSITLRYKNVEILTDAGSYLYNRNNPHRRCVESSYGHSGIFPAEGDGLLRKEFLRWFGPVSGGMESFEQNGATTRVQATFKLMNGAVSIARHIFVSKENEIAIVDKVDLVDPAKYRKEHFVQRFLAGPDMECRRGGEKTIFMQSGELKCSMFQLSDIDSSSLYKGEENNKVRGWQSYSLGVINPTFGIDFYQKLRNGKLQFATVISLNGAASYDDCSPETQEFVRQTLGN